MDSTKRFRNILQNEEEPLRSVRLFLMVTLLVGLPGTLVELLLLGHTEDPLQWIPVLLLGGTIATLVACIFSPRKGVLNAFRLFMVLLVLSSGVGVVLHFRGNIALQLELNPNLAGWELFWKAITKGAPALAPGAMLQLGLVGLAWTYRHPAMATNAAKKGED
jgi:hypothetical protein